jgi:hypothetical protein
VDESVVDLGSLGLGLLLGLIGLPAILLTLTLVRRRRASKPER